MTGIRAVYQDGVFKPKEPVSLPEGCEVTVAADPPAETPLDRELRWLTGRTPEQIGAARARVLKASRPARPLPDGRTLADVVEGQWPGDETDEQVRDALERLS